MPPEGCTSIVVFTSSVKAIIIAPFKIIFPFSAEKYGLFKEFMV
jgi:hypothetical protein